MCGDVRNVVTQSSMLGPKLTPHQRSAIIVAQSSRPLQAFDEASEFFVAQKVQKARTINFALDLFLIPWTKGCSRTPSGQVFAKGS